MATRYTSRNGTTTTTTTKSPTTTTTPNPNRSQARSQDTDPVQDDNLDENDLARQGAKPVTGDASADANPEGDGGDVDETPKKTARDKADVDAGPYIQEPSGALDAAVRERENTEFKNAMPPDRTPDKVEQKINDEVGAQTTGTPSPPPPTGAGQPVPGEENTDTVFHRLLPDQASGAAVDRYRQEILAGAGSRVTRINETVDPPLGETSEDGWRHWTFTLVFGK